MLTVGSACNSDRDRTCQGTGGGVIAHQLTQSLHNKADGSFLHPCRPCEAEVENTVWAERKGFKRLPAAGHMTSRCSDSYFEALRSHTNGPDEIQTASSRTCRNRMQWL